MRISECNIKKVFNTGALRFCRGAWHSENLY